MDKIKIISVIKTFSKKELGRFMEFLDSPFFNKGKKYIARFYRELIKYYPDFNEENSIKEKVYFKLYPKEKYNDERFRKLSSELYKLAVDFLAVEDFISDEPKKQLSILSQLNERKLGSIFEIELKKSYSELQKIDLRNDYYNKKMYELISKEKFYFFQRKRSYALSKYDKEIEYFTKYSLSLFLSKYIERAMEKRFFNSKEFELPLFEEILKYIEQSKYLTDPVINILYLQLKLSLQDDDQSYFKLRKLLHKEEKKLDSNQIKIIYTILSNYAIERSEKGAKEFQEEILNINLEIVRKNLIEQYLSGFLFVNIVTLFLKFKKIKQLDKFIKENSGRLNPDIKDTILNYCYSCQAFQKKEYDNALRNLSKINFEHYQLKFQIKNLTLKIYYEQKQYESIFSLIDSYRHILAREKTIPESIKKTILSFIKFLKELSEIKSGKKKSDKWILLKEIDASLPADKNWLIEKINEL
ncbi:MAG: hypothetical protein ABI840_05865 [bacterium]